MKEVYKKTSQTWSSTLNLAEADQRWVGEVWGCDRGSSCSNVEVKACVTAC